MAGVVKAALAGAGVTLALVSVPALATPARMPAAPAAGHEETVHTTANHPWLTAGECQQARRC